ANPHVERRHRPLSSRRQDPKLRRRSAHGGVRAARRSRHPCLRDRSSRRGVPLQRHDRGAPRGRRSPERDRGSAAGSGGYLSPMSSASASASSSSEASASIPASQIRASRRSSPTISASSSGGFEPPARSTSRYGSTIESPSSSYLRKIDSAKRKPYAYA